MKATLVLLTSLSLFNTPYPKQLTLWPSLRVEEPIGLFYWSIEGGARCQPINTTLWNPITAHWDVEAGARVLGASLAIGHRSEHGIDKIQPMTESYDYVKFTYTIK